MQNVVYLLVELIELFPAHRTRAVVPLSFPHCHSADHDIVLFLCCFFRQLRLVLDLITDDPVNLLEIPLPTLSPPRVVLLSSFDPVEQN